MKTSLKALSLSNGRLLPLTALLALGAAPALLAADASATNRREFQLGADSIKLFEPSTPAAPDKSVAGQPSAAGQPGVAAAPVMPPLLVAPATPPPPAPASDRRSFNSPDGGLVLNPKAVRIGSGNAPATVPGSRREFKVGGP